MRNMKGKGLLMAKKKQETMDKWYESRIVPPRVMEEGEEIEGVLVAITKGGQTPVLVIRDSNGEIHRIWSSTVLENALTPQDIGKEIFLRYKGKSNTKQGRNVKEYDVGVARSGSGSRQPSDDIPF